MRTSVAGKHKVYQLQAELLMQVMKLMQAGHFLVVGTVLGMRATTAINDEPGMLVMANAKELDN